MPVYSVNGSIPINVYNVNGQLLRQAYDIDSNPLLGGVVSLKVMTYNVGGWYIGSGTNVPTEQDLEYYNLHSGMFANNNVDVLCIQEYWSNMSKAPRTADSVLANYFPYRNCRQSGNYYGRGICSKYELEDYTVNTYSNEASRYYDKGYITISGKRIAVFTTHLNVSDEAKKIVQTNELINALNQEDYFICCGDYNAFAPSKESAGYTKYVKPFIDAGFHTANFSDEFGFLVTCIDRGSWAEYVLDNIFTSPNIEVLNVYVDTTKLTDTIDDPIDHMPLIATLQIN